eukprot:gene29965-biopygen11725
MWSASRLSLTLALRYTYGIKVEARFCIWAVRKGNVECVRALLANGAEVNIQDKYGYSPLHSAAMNGHVECIKTLLDCGAEVNIQDKVGSSPMHCAAWEGRMECIKTLLASGAMVTIQNIHGHTALDIALQQGHQDCADAIRSLSQRSSDGDQIGGGQQPDQNSCGNRQTEIEELRTQLARARARIDVYATQLAVSRAKNDEYEVHRACMTGQEQVIASQDLETLELLLVNVDLECLRKAVFEKRVQRERNKARDAATECGVCLSAPKDTSLDPCGHTLCRSCSDLIQVCPICRQTISERRRVFL